MCCFRKTAIRRVAAGDTLLMRMSDDDFTDVVDTNLWIKPPGESDGPCNGGPAAGVWWPAAARELTRDVIG